MKTKIMIPVTYLDNDDGCQERGEGYLAVADVPAEVVQALCMAKDPALRFGWEDGVVRTIDVVETIVDIDDMTRTIFFEEVALALSPREITLWLRNNPPQLCGRWSFGFSE